MSSVKSLLVVDDDPTVRDFLQDYLTEHGYHVDCAADGEALRARLAERVPDVVLLAISASSKSRVSSSCFAPVPETACRGMVLIIYILGYPEMTSRINNRLAFLYASRKGS